MGNSLVCCDELKNKELVDEVLLTGLDNLPAISSDDEDKTKVNATQGKSLFQSAVNPIAAPEKPVLVDPWDQLVNGTGVNCTAFKKLDYSNSFSCKIHLSWIRRPVDGVYSLTCLNLLSYVQKLEDECTPLELGAQEKGGTNELKMIDLIPGSEAKFLVPTIQIWSDKFGFISNKPLIDVKSIVLGSQWLANSRREDNKLVILLKKIINSGREPVVIVSKEGSKTLMHIVCFDMDLKTNIFFEAMRNVFDVVQTKFSLNAVVSEYPLP